MESFEMVLDMFELGKGYARLEKVSEVFGCL